MADVPESQLYISVNGSGRWLSWVALAGLALAGLLIILLGSWLLGSRERLSGLNSELDRLARVDSLTGLRNRRDIEDRLLAELSAARRHQSSLAVLLIDIDHFKQVNDTQGHQAGDAALAMTAQTIKSMLRAEDSVGRWGGEEFLVVLPDTNTDGALTIAERLRAQVAKPGSGTADPRTTITVTIGVAVWTRGGIDDLISRADHALYAGKAAGRNNIKLAAIEPRSDPRQRPAPESHLDHEPTPRRRSQIARAAHAAHISSRVLAQHDSTLRQLGRQRPPLSNARRSTGQKHPSETLRRQ